MTGEVQRGTGVRAYPSAVRIRDLGRPKRPGNWYFIIRGVRARPKLSHPSGVRRTPLPLWPTALAESQRDTPRPIGERVDHL